MLKNTVILTESLIARVIKIAVGPDKGKYLVAKPGAKIDLDPVTGKPKNPNDFLPGVFDDIKSATRERNKKFWDPSELKDGGPRKGGDGKVRQAERDANGQPIIREYDGWKDYAAKKLKKNARSWNRGGTRVPLLINKFGDFKLILSLSSWASVLQLLAEWYDDTEVILELLDQDLMSRADAEAGFQANTKLTIFKIAAALAGGKLLQYIGHKLIGIVNLIYRLNPSTKYWMMALSGPVQKQFLTWLIREDIILEDTARWLVRMIIVEDFLNLGAKIIEQFPIADVGPRLEQWRRDNQSAIDSAQSTAPRSTDTPQGAAPVARKPVTINVDTDDIDTILKKMGDQ